MADYSLLMFKSEDGNPHAGLRAGDQVVDLTAAGQVSGVDCESTLSILYDWERGAAMLEALADDVAAGRTPPAACRPLAETELLPPLWNPGAIFCAAANYTDHMKEMSGR